MLEYAIVIVMMGCVVLLARRLAMHQNLKRNPRGLFYFNDGVKVIGVDPIAVMQTLEGDPEYVKGKHLELAWQGDAESIRICSAAARRAFGVPRMTEKTKPGLTERECLELLDSYYWWVDGVKKNIASLPKQPPSMESTSQESVANNA